ncbi:MAG TPA: AMP-binding protein, partial [Myxococcaceae bacterium]|nr:AMP-binding protein [Myxococcaceae bacterium]
MELKETADTFPKLLVENARRFGEKIALREKEFGIWQSFSWGDYCDRVRDLSLGLLALGMQRGDKVAIIGDNRPEWVYSEIAAQSLGGAAVGLYQDSNLNEVAYVIDHCDAAFVVAEDQEQVDKVLGMLEKLPKVKRVIYTDPRGLRDYKHPALLSFDAVAQSGRKLLGSEPECWLESVRRGRADDLALISYTSGTTGFPKGAMLSFRNLLTMALNLHEVDPKKPSDEFVSFLPLAWIGEQMMSLSTALAVGFTVNFPEEPETAMENIREIGPQVMFAPPRIWENLSSAVQVKMMDATPLKRLAFGALMPVGYKLAECRFKREVIPLHWQLLYRLAELGLFRSLRDRLGLSFVRSGSTGGAALGPDVFRFFHAIGVPLKQIYGQTEISGISCIHRDGDIQFGTV